MSKNDKNKWFNGQNSIFNIIFLNNGSIELSSETYILDYARKNPFLSNASETSDCGCQFGVVGGLSESEENVLRAFMGEKTVHLSILSIPFHYLKTQR